jgi:hypothetical protein
VSRIVAASIAHNETLSVERKAAGNVKPIPVFTCTWGKTLRAQITLNRFYFQQWRLRSNESMHEACGQI